MSLLIFFSLSHFMSNFGILNEKTNRKAAKLNEKKCSLNKNISDVSIKEGKCFAFFFSLSLVANKKQVNRILPKKKLFLFQQTSRGTPLMEKKVKKRTVYSFIYYEHGKCELRRIKKNQEERETCQRWHEAKQKAILIMYLLNLLNMRCSRIGGGTNDEK